MQCRITGLKEIDNALAQLERTEARKIIRSSMRQGLKLMLAKARELSPVRSGATRKGVKIRAMKAKRRGEMAITVQIKASDDLKKTSAKTGKTVFYPAIVEFGRKLKSGRVIPANDFLKRAFNDTQSQVRDRTNELIRAGLNAALNWWHKI